MSIKTEIKKEYDIIFLNPQIADLVEAMLKLKKGLRVIFVFENELNREDNFQTTETFPYEIRDFAGLLNKHANWKKLFLLVPHLVQSQKILYCGSSAQLKTVAKFADLIYKNHYSHQSKILDINKPEHFTFLKYSRLKGILFHEYKINVSRLFIELLKHFEFLGGQIVFKKSNVLKNIPEVIKVKSKKKWCYKIPMVCNSDFGIVARRKDLKFRIDVVDNAPVLQHYKNHHQNKNIFELLDNLIESNFINKNNRTEYETNELLSAKTIKNILELFNKPLKCSFAGSSVDDNYEICLEKFDVAKQTGISYEEFKMLFYRYGAGIDEMTEEAYQLMNKIREPKKIWFIVQEFYMKKYEWKN